MNVLTSPVAVSTNGCLLQNLGPSTAYLGESTITPGSGVKLLINQAIVIGSTNSQVYLVSDSSSDVRVLDRGSGMFSIT